MESQGNNTMNQSQMDSGPSSSRPPRPQSSNSVNVPEEEMETDEFTLEEEMQELETPKEAEEQCGRSKRKEMCKRAKAWDHFTLYIDKNGKTRARCNHCGKTYAAHSTKNGTSTLNGHMKVCKNHIEDHMRYEDHMLSCCPSEFS